MTTLIKSKILGSFYGLAMGDALGFPAMYHRTLQLGWRRQLMLDFNKQADSQRINKFSMPFTLGSSEDDLNLCGTDDTEFAAVSALILSECLENPSIDNLFNGWNKYVVDSESEIWSGISERASIENAKKGHVPPVTGNDNPHHFDDGAVARAVPVGWLYYEDCEKAANIAGKMASITNAEDGIYAAKAMAVSIAKAISGESLKECIEEGISVIPKDSWLYRKIDQAREILIKNKSGFAAVVEWNNRIVNSIYNYGNVAPETLAVAYAIFEATDGRLQEGLQLASLVPKQADSMPAMVGALSGAFQGIEVIPNIWTQKLNDLKGICIPSLRGQTLTGIVSKLLENPING